MDPTVTEKGEWIKYIVPEMHNTVYAYCEHKQATQSG